MTFLIQALSGNFFQSRMTLVGSQNQTSSWQIISICQIHPSTESRAWTAAENCVHTGGVNWICAAVNWIFAAVRDAVTSDWQVHARWFARILWANKSSLQVSCSFEACSASFCVFWVLAEQGSSKNPKVFFTQWSFLFLSFNGSLLWVFSSAWRQSLP